MSDYEDELLKQYGMSEQPKEEGAWKNILVFVETEKIKLKPVCCAAVGKARELADSLGVRLDVFFPSYYDNQIWELVSYGAERVYIGAVNEVLGLIERDKYEIVLFGESGKSGIIAPRIAQHFNAGLVMGVRGLSVNLDDRSLVTTRAVYGGMMLLEETFKRKPQLAVVEDGAFSMPVADKSRKGDIIKL